jgi:signal transduction histidine kinase
VTALVDNAVRHATGRVTVSVDAEGRSAHVDVVDDGPGIDPELAPRMFDRFATGRDGVGPGRRRYGIGLSLVNEIVTAHDGQVEVLRRDVRGAALRITLPIARRAILRPGRRASSG